MSIGDNIRRAAENMRRDRCQATGDAERIVIVPIEHPDWPGEPVNVRVTIADGQVKWIATPTGSNPPNYFSTYVREQVERATELPT